MLEVVGVSRADVVLDEVIRQRIKTGSELAKRRICAIVQRSQRVQRSREYCELPQTEKRQPGVDVKDEEFGTLIFANEYRSRILELNVELTCSLRLIVSS